MNNIKYTVTCRSNFNNCKMQHVVWASNENSAKEIMENEGFTVESVDVDEE